MGATSQSRCVKRALPCRVNEVCCAWEDDPPPGEGGSGTVTSPSLHPMGRCDSSGWPATACALMAVLSLLLLEIARSLCYTPPGSRIWCGCRTTATCHSCLPSPDYTYPQPCAAASGRAQCGIPLPRAYEEQVRGQSDGAAARSSASVRAQMGLFAVLPPSATLPFLQPP